MAKALRLQREASTDDRSHPRFDLEYLFRRYHKELLAYLSGKFGSGPPEPEDVVQATFEKLATYRDRDNIGNARAFLYTTARHLVIDYHRRDQRSQDYVDDVLHRIGEENLAQITPERVIEQRERFEILSQQVQRLSEKQQVILRLSRIDGLTYEGISQRTGWSRSDISRQIRAAVSVLQDTLQRADQ